MGLDELNKLYLRQMNRDGQEQQAFVLGEGKQDNPLLMLVGLAPRRAGGFAAPPVCRKGRQES